MRCLPAWLAAALLLPGALPAQRSLRPADVTVTLEIAKSFFADDEPIPVDVYVTNDTGEDLKADVFYPASSSVGLPDFHFIDALTGKRGEEGYRQLWMNFYELKELVSGWNKEGRFDPETARREVTILDRLDQTAVARLDAEWGIDFFHLAKIDGTWTIMNVIWQTYPPAPEGE